MFWSFSSMIVFPMFNLSFCSWVLCSGRLLLSYVLSVVSRLMVDLLVMGRRCKSIRLVFGILLLYVLPQSWHLAWLIAYPFMLDLGFCVFSVASSPDSGGYTGGGGLRGMCRPGDGVVVPRGLLFSRCCFMRAPLFWVVLSLGPFAVFCFECLVLYSCFGCSAVFSMLCGTR